MAENPEFQLRRTEQVEEKFTYRCSICRKDLGEMASMLSSYPACHEHIDALEEAAHNGIRVLVGAEAEEFRTFQGLEVVEVVQASLTLDET